MHIDRFFVIWLCHCIIVTLSVIIHKYLSLSVIIGKRLKTQFGNIDYLCYDFDEMYCHFEDKSNIYSFLWREIINQSH